MEALTCRQAPERRRRYMRCLMAVEPNCNCNNYDGMQDPEPWKLERGRRRCMRAGDYDTVCEVVGEQLVCDMHSYA